MSDAGTPSKRAEANRRNAARSTGPRTPEGKARSRFNAVKHGMRAATPVLPGEDADAFDARLNAWTSELDPRGDVECFLVRRAVQLSWQIERADRALAARSAEARRELDDYIAGIAEEVVAAGRKLFWSPLGPLALYPNNTCDLRYNGAISWSADREDPDAPARLVVRLEATPQGCAWMLDRWADLRSVLEGGGAWLGSDRFRAIRLLGHQPMEAPEADRVRTIYRACWAIRPEGENAYADVRHELGPVHWERWLNRLEGREVPGSPPLDEATARAALLELIAAEEERLETILAQHLEREESSVSDELFDAGPDGERLRRYEARCDRTLLRILDILSKRRRDAERADSAPRRTAAAKAPAEPIDWAARVEEMPDGLQGITDLATNEANRASQPVAAPNEAGPGPGGDAAPNEASTSAGSTPAPNEAKPPADVPDRSWPGLLAALAILLALVLTPAVPAPQDRSDPDHPTIGTPVETPWPPDSRSIGPVRSARAGRAFQPDRRPDPPALARSESPGRRRNPLVFVRTNG